PPRLFADHEGHDVGNVLGDAKSFERRSLLSDLAKGGIGREHSRVRVSGRDRIHGDSLGRKFVRKTFRELFESTFAAEVGSSAGKTDMGAVSGNIHDTSTFLDDLCRFLQGKVRALGIEGKHAVELLLGRLDQGLVHEHPGVVDQDVQPAEYPYRVLDQPADITDFAHIGLHRDCLATFLITPNYYL